MAKMTPTLRDALQNLEIAMITAANRARWYEERLHELLLGKMSQERQNEIKKELGLTEEATTNLPVFNEAGQRVGTMETTLVKEKP